MTIAPEKGLAGCLFDKDGTLVDFHRTWGPAGHAVMTRMAGGDAAALERLAAALHFDLVTQRFAATSALIAGTTEDVVVAWAGAIGRPIDRRLVSDLNEAFAEETLRALSPLGEPAAVLRRLKARGLRLGLATNDAEANARAHLAALGLDAFMDFVAGYDSGHGGKPGPGMVTAFAETIGEPPQRVALVGDSLHDLRAARAAGAVAIAVTTGPAAPETLAPFADHMIADLEALPELLDGLAR